MHHLKLKEKFSAKSIDLERQNPRLKTHFSYCSTTGSQLLCDVFGSHHKMTGCQAIKWKYFERNKPVMHRTTSRNKKKLLNSYCNLSKMLVRTAYFKTSLKWSAHSLQGYSLEIICIWTCKPVTMLYFCVNQVIRQCSIETRDMNVIFAPPKKECFWFTVLDGNLVVV